MSKCITFIHLLHLLFPKFSTGVLTNVALGTVIIVSLPVLIIVVLKLISSTVPSTLPIMTQSPTLNGLSKRTVTAPKKLEIVSFAARARARPDIPKPAISDVKSRPTASAMNTPPVKIIMNFKILSRAEINVFSDPSMLPSSSNFITKISTIPTNLNAHNTKHEAAKNWKIDGSMIPAYSGIMNKASSLAMSFFIH